MDRFSWERAVREDREVVGTEMLVLLTVATYMDADGTGAFPSQERIAGDAGVSERTVRRHLSAALKKGWLQLVQRGHGRWQGGSVSNTYSVSTPLQPAASGRLQSETDSGNRPPVANDPPATGQERPVAELTPAQQATSGHEGPDDGPDEPLQPATGGPTTGHSYGRLPRDHETPTSSFPSTHAGCSSTETKKAKIEPLEPLDWGDPLQDPTVIAWQKRHSIPNNTHPPSKPWDVFMEMGRRRLAFMQNENDRTGRYGDSLPPRELDYRCEAWAKKQASDYKRQYGGRLNDLLADNPGRDPDWYVYALDRTLASVDWSVPSTRERHLRSVKEAS